MRKQLREQLCEQGFTLIEMIVSVVILSVAILALSTSTTRLVRVAVSAETNALALQAVEDRISEVRLHPIYQQLDSLYTESGVTVPHMDGFTRATKIDRIIKDGERAGKFIDFTRITVSVDGPGLGVPVSRTITIGGF